MNTVFKALVVSTMMLGVSATAFAGPDWDRGHGPRDRHHAPAAKWDHDRRHDNGHRDYRGHRFQRGDRLPAAWRHDRYQVNNWRAYRLKTPPRGYHWVRADGRYLLVSNYNHRIYQVY